MQSGRLRTFEHLQPVVPAAEPWIFPFLESIYFFSCWSLFVWVSVTSLVWAHLALPHGSFQFLCVGACVKNFKKLWQKPHNTKVTILTVSKCPDRGILCTRSGVQPSPPSSSRAFSSSHTETPCIKQPSGSFSPSTHHAALCLHEADPSGYLV